MIVVDIQTWIEWSWLLGLESMMKLTCSHSGLIILDFSVQHQQIPKLRLTWVVPASRRFLGRELMFTACACSFGCIAGSRARNCELTARLLLVSSGKLV